MILKELKIEQGIAYVINNEEEYDLFTKKCISQGYIVSINMKASVMKDLLSGQACVRFDRDREAYHASFSFYENRGYKMHFLEYHDHKKETQELFNSLFE